MLGEHLINNSGKMIVMDKLLTKLKSDMESHKGIYLFIYSLFFIYKLIILVLIFS